MNSKNGYKIGRGRLNKNGYDWWWHSFTGYDEITNEERAFFIEYFIINPGLYKDHLLDIYQNGKPCYAMIKAGSWGKHKQEYNKRYAVSDFSYTKSPFSVSIGSNVMTNTMLKGAITIQEEDTKNINGLKTDFGTMSWNLNISKNHSYDVGYGTNKFLSYLGIFQMFWHIEGVKTLYEGTIMFKGRKYIVSPENSYGYQDKNWGSDYTNPWLWLNSSNIHYKGDNESLKNTYFDFGGGKPVVLGIPLQNRILGVFCHENKVYEYNFSKLHLRSKENFKSYEDNEYRYWDIQCINKKSKIVIKFKVKKEDLLLVHYENPKGEINHKKLYNGGTAFGEIQLYEKKKNKYHLIAEFEGYNGGCEYGEY